jgi:glycosyltransferase 2 family protein
MLLTGKLAGAALLSVLLWMTIDWHEALTVVAHADRSLLIGAFCASVGTVLISARKWQLLLQRARISVGFPAAAQLYWIGAFFSNFMPTGIGGDAVRLMMTPAPDGRSRVAATILIERLTGLLVMLGLSVIGLLILPLDLGGPVPHFVTVAGVAALAVAVTLVLFMPARFLGLLEIVQPYLPGFARTPFAFAHRVAVSVLGRDCSATAVWGALLYSLPFYGAMMLAQYCMLRAAGADVGMLAVVLGAPLVALVTLLPITVNGLFLAEGAFVLIYASTGIPAEVALAAAILRRLVDLANSGLGSVLWLAWQLGSADLEQDGRSSQTSRTASISATASARF